MSGQLAVACHLLEDHYIDAFHGYAGLKMFNQRVIARHALKDLNTMMHNMHLGGTCPTNVSLQDMF